MTWGARIIFSWDGGWQTSFVGVSRGDDPLAALFSSDGHASWEPDATLCDVRLCMYSYSHKDVLGRVP